MQTSYVRHAVTISVVGLVLFLATPPARAVTCNGSNGSPCDDGNACTQNDTCQNGTCVGGFPITCPQIDACHAAGTCNPATGICSNPIRPDGTACNDGNACTQNDNCHAGVCTGGNPVICTASDQCHSANCDPVTGACSNQTKPDGTGCNDADSCTSNDVCVSGACAGAPFTCAAPNQCQDAGSCNGDGTCSYANKPYGTTCNDGDPSNLNDICNSGVCSGVAFHVTSTTLAAGTFSVTFSTGSGRHYSLEASSDLSNWAPVSNSAFTGDGKAHTSTVDVSSSPARSFVRVLVGP